MNLYSSVVPNRRVVVSTFQVGLFCFSLAFVSSFCPTQQRHSMTHENTVPGKEPIVIGSLEMDSEPAVDPQVQPGIQNIEAVTMVWSTSALIAAYTMTWLI